MSVVALKVTREADLLLGSLAVVDGKIMVKLISLLSIVVVMTEMKSVVVVVAQVFLRHDMTVSIKEFSGMEDEDPVSTQLSSRQEVMGILVLEVSVSVSSECKLLIGILEEPSAEVELSGLELSIIIKEFVKTEELPIRYLPVDDILIKEEELSGMKEEHAVKEEVISAARELKDN